MFSSITGPFVAAAVLSWKGEKQLDLLGTPWLWKRPCEEGGSRRKS